jgi:hypothetical protein
VALVILPASCERTIPQYKKNDRQMIEYNMKVVTNNSIFITEISSDTCKLLRQ